MERWNDRGAAIIPYGNSIILMRRERGYGKNKQVYYTIPGGGREEGERIDQTTIREMKEELGIDIEVVELMYKLDTIKRMQYIFLGKYVSGKLGTGTGEEFQDVDYNKYGKYIPEVVTLEKLKKIKLVPTNLKREIIREFNYIIGKSETRLNKKTRIDTGFNYNKFQNNKNSNINNSEKLNDNNLEKTNNSINNNSNSKFNTNNSDDSNINVNNKNNELEKNRNKFRNLKNSKNKLHLETYNKVIHVENEINTKIENINNIDKKEDEVIDNTKNNKYKKFIRRNSEGKVFSKKHQILNNYNKNKSINVKKRRDNTNKSNNTNLDNNDLNNNHDVLKRERITEKSVQSGITKFNNKKAFSNSKKEKKGINNKKNIIENKTKPQNYTKNSFFKKKMNKRNLNK